MSKEGELMKKILGTVLVLLLFLLVGGCAPPPMPEVTPDRTFSTNFDTTWRAVVDALSDESYPIQAIEKESGVITTEFVIFTRGWLSAENQIERVAVLPGVLLGTWTTGRYTLSVFVMSVEKGTRVRIRAHIEGYEENMTHRWHACQSKGTLEEELLNAIGDKLSEG